LAGPNGVISSETTSGGEAGACLRAFCCAPLFENGGTKVCLVYAFNKEQLYSQHFVSDTDTKPVSIFEATLPRRSAQEEIKEETMDEHKRDANDALKKKYEQLKAKREAKQQQKGEGGGGSGAAGGGGGGGATLSGVSGILQQMESSASKLHLDDATKESLVSTVKAAALDRSAIEAFKAARGPTGGDPLPKRAKATGLKLLSVPKLMSAGGTSGIHSEGRASGTDGSPTPGSAGGAKSAGHGEKIDGFPRRVHEALQRIFAEGSLRRDEIEEKVLVALRNLTESDALRALDQFGNEDMSRIRNKAAYLWGIVRNVREGRNKPQLGGSGPFGRDDDVGSAASSDLKLLWPEEENIMQVKLQ